MGAKTARNDTERKARAFDALSKICQSAAIGNGIAIFPIVQSGEARISLQDLGDDDGSAMGEEIAVAKTLLEAVELANAQIAEANDE